MHEIHCPKIKAADAIHCVVCGADEYHSDVVSPRILFEPLKHLKSIHSIELDIKKNDIRLHFARHFKTFFTTGCAVNLNLLELKTCAKQTMHEF